MSFLNFEIKYLVLIIPFLIIGLFLLFKNYKKQKLFNDSYLSKMRNYNYSQKIFNFKNIILLICVLLLIVSILRPAWGSRTQTIEASGSDIIFTLDVSKSMKAIDMNDDGGKLDRLSMAKNMITNFVEEYPQNRYGLVIFAGEAFVSSPLTIDQSAFLTFLQGVDYNDVSSQGTDMGEALKASIDRFYSEQEKERGRSIVLMSDGGEDITEDVEDFAKVAYELNINIFTIGIGSTKEVAIPEGQDIFGRISYKKHNGQIVKTKLNEDVLKQIAKETDGQYFHANKKDDLRKISKKIEAAKATTIQVEQKGGVNDRYQYFLLPSFILFLLFIFIKPKKIDKLFIIKLKHSFKKYFNNLEKIIHKYLKFSVLILSLFSLTACSSSELSFRYYLKKGNDNFSKEYLGEARDNYLLAGDRTKKSRHIAKNNLAIVDFREQTYNKSKERLEEVTVIYCDEKKYEFCDQLYYNLGNTYYRLGENNKNKDEQRKLWEQAVASYEKDLEINADDQKAKENIDFILNKLKEAEESESSEGEDGSQSDQSEGESEDKEGEQGESQEGLEDSEETDDKSGEETGSEGAESTGLDKETNKKVEQYLEDLEKQEQSNQKYFQPNPDAQNNQNSMNNFFGGEFNNESDSNEIDW